MAAAASLALGLLLVLAVEYLAGLVVPSGSADSPKGDVVSETLAWLDLNPAPLVEDPDLLWRNQPRARRTQLVSPRAFGRSEQWTLENNSEGFRGPELQASKRGATAVRILCVGDSITFGFNVNQPDAYPRQLTAILEERYPGTPFEVLNAGVPGWTWLQGLRFLELQGFALDPDIVVIGHGTNDQFFPATTTDEERFQRLASPLQKMVRGLASMAARTNISRAVSRFTSAPNSEPVSPGCREQIQETGGCHRVSTQEIEEILREIDDLASKREIGILVVNTDFLQTRAAESLRSVVEQEKIAFVDPVAEVLHRRRVWEARRAERLGLAQASQRDAGDPGTPGVRRATLRVLVPDPERRYGVAGTGLYRPDFSFEVPLRDDGLGADEKAGDSVFSAWVDVPAEFLGIEYLYYQGQTPEFAVVPPFVSALGARALRTPTSGLSPVDVFGESFLMVERAHPDREGQRVIAELVADGLESIPAFRSALERASS